MIFLDVDGVLANFIDGAIEACDLPIKHDDVTCWDFFRPWMSPTTFWGRIRAYSDFWEGLEPYPWAQELVDACGPDVIYCTSPGADPDAPSGKLKWLQRMGFLEGPFDQRFVITANKDLLAAPGRLLIDDSRDNLNAWGDRAGSTLVWPQKWNWLPGGIPSARRLAIAGIRKHRADGVSRT